MLYHGSGSLSDLGEYVAETVATLTPHLSRFDCIAVTGMSGVILGSPVALQLGVPLVVLRKESDDSHDYGKIINLENSGQRFLIVDDFISSGKTYHRIRQHLGEYEGLDYAGVYLYGDGLLSWDGDGVICYRPHLADEHGDTTWGITSIDLRNLPEKSRRTNVSSKVVRDEPLPSVANGGSYRPIDDYSIREGDPKPTVEVYKASSGRYERGLPAYQRAINELCEQIAGPDTQLDFSHYREGIAKRNEALFGTLSDQDARNVKRDFDCCHDTTSGDTETS